MKDKSWIFWVIIGIAFFGGGFPILPFAIIGLCIYQAEKKKKEKMEVLKKVYQSDSSHLTSSQQQLIYRSLRAYFSENDRIVVSGDINLRPKKGNFTSTNDLYVYKGEDYVSSLQEFKSKYQEIYDNILDLLLVFAQMKASDRQSFAKKNTEPTESETKETKSTVKNEYDSANEYIEHINELNNQIPQEEITNGLYQTCAYLKQLELIETNYPKKRKEMNKVYHYYLPILLGILDDYKAFSSSSSNHEDFKKIEDKLTKTIILINEALKNLTTSLCDDEVMNLNADMTTLEMLLKKDGLVDNNVLQASSKKEEK